MLYINDVVHTNEIQLSKLKPPNTIEIQEFEGCSKV